MSVFDDRTNPHQVPKVWMHPIYGSGMTVTGDETIKGSRCTDWGDRYGYCYQPQHYQVASSGMATASSFVG